MRPAARYRAGACPQPDGKVVCGVQTVLQVPDGNCAKAYASQSGRAGALAGHVRRTVQYRIIQCGVGQLCRRLGQVHDRKRLWRGHGAFHIDIQLHGSDNGIVWYRRNVEIEEWIVDIVIRSVLGPYKRNCLSVGSYKCIIYLAVSGTGSIVIIDSGFSDKSRKRKNEQGSNQKLSAHHYYWVYL